MTPKKRGRPPLYKYEDRLKLADLIRRYGARQAQEVANSPVCIATLLKIAKEFDIELRKGRRSKRAY